MTSGSGIRSARYIVKKPAKDANKIKYVGAIKKKSFYSRIGNRVRKAL